MLQSTGAIHELVLAPDVTAAGDARHWVRDRLRALQREDLIESAVLATSELVTNVILHARTTIRVRIVEETDLRIEIYDESPGHVQSRTATDALDAESDLAAAGNGLNILAAVTRHWGVRRSRRPGKTVWFVPAADDDRDADDRASSSDSVADPNHETVEVTLLDAPVTDLMHARERIQDLARELRLISLDVGPKSDVPADLLQLAERITELGPFERPTQTQRAGEPVAATGTATLHYLLDSRLAGRCQEFDDLLDIAEAYCRSEDLLTLPASSREVAVRRWFLREFAAQASGCIPTPWAG